MSMFKKIIDSAINQVLVENSNSTFKSALIGKNKNIQSIAILTSENPYGKKLNRKQNKDLLARLKAQLKDGGYPYQQIRGKYEDNNEHSFAIYNISRGGAKSCANSYGQMAFIFGRKQLDDNNQPYMLYEYWQNDGPGTIYRKIHQSKKIINQADVDDFFSRLRSYKFKIGFRIDETIPEDVLKTLNEVQLEKDKQWLNEYIDGKRVGYTTHMYYNYLYHSKSKGEK